MRFHILNLLDQIGRTCANIICIFFQHVRRQRLSRHHLVAARVSLECTDRRYQHRSIRRHTRDAAFDVEETFCAHVGAESSFRNQVVTQVNSQFVGDDR